MASLFKDKRGLSQVVTTLILLVVSVLLAGVVTYYATNITMTRTQQEEVRLSKQHIWVNSTGAVGAFMLQNLGGKDVLIYKIEVRGVKSSWSTVYYYRVPSGTTITGDLNVTSYDNLTGSNATIDGKTYSQASGDIPVISGEVLLFYIKGPDNISVNDIGTTVSITVYTINAPYIVECNVEAAT
ncbi:MAG: archaellin/type IV pilin N-terminal domain-containing protein [Candidatus Bathyarchaeia archaeon]